MWRTPPLRNLYKSPIFLLAAVIILYEESLNSSALDSGLG